MAMASPRKFSVSMAHPQDHHHVSIFWTISVGGISQYFPFSVNSFQFISVIRKINRNIHWNPANGISSINGGLSTGYGDCSRNKCHNQVLPIAKRLPGMGHWCFVGAKRWEWGNPIHTNNHPILKFPTSSKLGDHISRAMAARTSTHRPSAPSTFQCPWGTIATRWPVSTPWRSSPRGHL